MLQIENIGLLQNIAELGGLGVALWWIWSLRKDVCDLSVQLSKLNEEHKNDLRINSSILQQLQQSVLQTLNDFKISKKDKESEK